MIQELPNGYDDFAHTVVEEASISGARRIAKWLEERTNDYEAVKYWNKLADEWELNDWSYDYSKDDNG